MRTVTTRRFACFTSSQEFTPFLHSISTHHLNPNPPPRLPAPLTPHSFLSSPELDSDFFCLNRIVHISFSPLLSSTSRFKDLNLDQNLAPLKHSLGKAVTTGGEKLSRAVTNGSKGIGKAMEVLWAELEKGLDSGASSAAGPDREKEKKRRSLGPVYKSEVGFGATVSPAATYLQFDPRQSFNISYPRGSQTDLNRSPLSSYPPRQMTPLRTSTSNSASTSGDGTILGAINLEATTQQAGKLLSNVGTFFRNRQREIATAVREGWEPDRSAPATASAPPPSSSSGNNYGRRAVSLRLPTVMRPASGATPESQAGSRS
ncbi:hypothetical protein BC936DRAFT_143599, partial [Jimgerdemannia flammicorona]